MIIYLMSCLSNLLSSKNKQTKQIQRISSNETFVTYISEEE